MSLNEYKRKRVFNKTPEPTGNFFVDGIEKPIFVIQKHNASHLHYDFRLEHKKVLLSWAIPKGPSLNPNDKHLAAKVEDHPLEYAMFEGTIPEGNYGAGTVMVWDLGSYGHLEAKTKKEVERKIDEGLKKGHFGVVLYGKKLKGEFVLARLKDNEKNWLFFKKRDEFAQEKFKFDETSVLSNRTIEEIEKAKEITWASRKKRIDLFGAPEAKMPHHIKPMLARLADDTFNNEDWIFEIKWDGYRAISEVRNNNVDLYSRNLLYLNDKFPEIVSSLRSMNYSAIFDGEIVVVDKNSKPSFQMLQDYWKKREGTPTYYIFDLLYLDGHDLRGEPLLKRKEILSQILPKDDQYLKYCDHVEEKGINFYELAVNMGLEGIVAKKKDSAYRSGIRTNNWLKMKKVKTTEAVIGGFTEPRGGRQYFGALILGKFIDGKLKYIGHTGGGFTDEKIKKLYEKIIQLKQETSPFTQNFKTNAPVYWIKPEIVCEVKFLEYTNEGLLRQPIFLWLREDIEPIEVGPEKVAGLSLLNQRGDKEEIVINDHKLIITNPNKIYWPEDGYAKRDLINYYEKISDIILPHLKDRPESLNRFPEGIHGEHFYHKNIESDKIYLPSWVKTIKIDQTTNYLLCQNKETLFFMANLGCIEINPWSSRVGKLDNPDYCVVDLDPMDIEFKYVVEAAIAVHEILEKAGIKNYCKTSGATGLHIYVPLGGKYNYDQSKEFGKIIALLANKKLPKTTTVERKTEKRGKTVYLDFLQNNRGQTLAAPYSVRPVHGAQVSTPLLWSELNDKLSPKNFNIKNMNDRVNKLGDIFSPVLTEETDLKEVLDLLA